MYLAVAALLLGRLVHPVQAQYDPFHTPVIDSIRAAEDSTSATNAARADTSGDDRHVVIRGLEALDGFLPLWLFERLLVLAFVVIPFGCAAGFAAVALFSDSGSLRVLLAVMGWLAALLGGLISGGLVGTVLGALSFFGWTGVIASGLGYPILFLRARRTVTQLPRAEYVTWKHTLAGGALLGTGASSAARLARSAGALFKGGGGSFGGGGASGTFGGGQAVSVTAASAQGASVPGAVVASSASTAAAGRAASAVGGPAGGGRFKRWAETVVGFARRLRWYHGVAFVLIGLVFLPVGMGVASIFQRPRLLLWIAGVYTLCRAYWLLGRVMGGHPPAVVSAIFTMILFMAPFIGGALAAESHAPHQHLVITLIIAAVIEVGFFVLPDNRPQVEPPSDQAAPFRGGTISESW